MEVRDEERKGYCNSSDHTEIRRRRRGGRELKSAVNGFDASSETLDPLPPPPTRVDYLLHLQPNHRPTTRIAPDPDPDPDPISLAPASPKRNSNVESPPRVVAPSDASSTVVRYRECQKNHAASYGGHVVDGCGEFMPDGDEGTPESLKCAACGCHRSFHRKEIDGEQINPNSNYNQYSNFYNTISPITRNPHNTQNHIVVIHDPHHHHHQQPPPPPQQPRQPLNRHASPIMVSFGAGGGPAESSTENLEMFHQSVETNGLMYQQKPKKRFRTKFNQEQKEKMMEFAEKLGWKMSKQDEEDVRRFCSELDLKRQVFKVWMHNNKQAMKRKPM